MICVLALGTNGLPTCAPTHVLELPVSISKVTSPEFYDIRVKGTTETVCTYSYFLQL